MKKMKIIIILLLILLATGYCVISYILAKTIVYPNVMSLEEERQWIEDHKLVGNFDSYIKQNYKIKAYNDYEINAQLVKADDVNSKKYVIISHGFRSNRNGAIKYVDVYHDLGYNVIIFY